MDRCFTLAGYLKLIDEFRALGYRCRRFGDEAPVRGDLYLRHDVDYCLRAAAAMADAEASIGISSTWFVLVRSPLFNPFGADERELLRRLRHDGGAIGLHFDASYYQDQSIGALELAAAQECTALALASDGPVVAISFHKPPPALATLESHFAGLPHCSQPAFIRDSLYCSDTLARFGHGDPIVLARERAIPPVHLLTHPIWWTGDEDDDGLSKLDRFVEQRELITTAAVARSVTAFRMRLMEAAQ